MKFQRCHGEIKYLTDLYAPNGAAGFYIIISEAVGNFVGYQTIVGHIVLMGGKLRRVWMS